MDALRVCLIYVSCLKSFLALFTLQAMLEGGREVSWSHCLVAVGSLGPVPCRSEQLTVAGLEEEVRGTADLIKRAEKVGGLAH